MNKWLIVICFILMILACTKEYNETTIISSETVELAEEYFPLKVGNQWIYKVSECDSLEQNCTFLKYDTVEILAITVIDSDTFYVFSNSSIYFYSPLKTDSIYLVDSEGAIKFCSDENLTISANSHLDSVAAAAANFEGFYKLIKDDFSVYVPAGVFPVVNYQGQFYTHLNNYSRKYYSNNYFAKDIGIVKFTYQSYLNAAVHLNELYSYSINE